ncbi:MAG TPA: T9SS type A sorting domain-containing protein [Flavobacteriales bacterium]|nr:T9SS type A sorting domain-containing protein [Flavobacteriales bacterium]HNU58038.1 T9SS type A sorting domain-containing protein [Flavobacteriales bacterium]
MELQTDLDTLEIPVAGYFGGVSNNYLDTLRADYAFVITQEPFFKSRPIAHAEDERPTQEEWDFVCYPNPAKDELFIRLPDDGLMDIVLHDALGRPLLHQSNVSGPLHRLTLGRLAAGAYAIELTDGVNRKTKKLIIH